MSKVTAFDDGSSIEWVDRETLRYRVGEFSTLVWVDFEPGLFSGGRIIKSPSIKNWEAFPPGSDEEIDEDARKAIIEKVELYYRKLKKRCRVE